MSIIENLDTREAGLGSSFGLVAPQLERGDSNVLDSIWSRWLMVFGGLLLGAAFGILLVVIGLPTYSATAEIVVEDPRTSEVVALPTSSNPERYVADQVEILRSFVVAQRAAEMLTTQDLPLPIPTTKDLLPEEGRLLIESPAASNVIRISFDAIRPEVAVAGANSVLQAYQEIRQEEAVRSTASALDQIDKRIAELDQDLENIASQLESNLPNEVERALRAQSLATLNRILELEAELLQEQDSQRIIQISNELEVLTATIPETAELVSSFDPSNIEGLSDQQSALITRRADLNARRDAIVVNSELTATGIAFMSLPAEPVRTGLSVQTSAVLGALLGLILAATVAHWLALRERHLSDHHQPASVLGVPLLAEIPAFSAERLKTGVPVRDSPRSVAAETFRFAASSLTMRLSSFEGNCVAVVSGVVGEGKSTTCANLGFALNGIARDNARVLLVDGDFGSQQLTTMLGGQHAEAGMTDVALGVSSLHSSVQQIKSEKPGSLFLLSRGLQQIDASSFFASQGLRHMLEQAREQFDIVIIDTPPMLQVAYASTLSQLADALVVVTRHRSNLSNLMEVRDKLALIDRACVGYVYTMASLREHMYETGGSMADVFGDNQVDWESHRGLSDG